MPIQTCHILSNERFAGDVYRLKFYSETIFRGAEPGQFVHIHTSTQSDPLLPRPFSIHDIDAGSMGVEILFQLVGVGTRLLASKVKGETIDVLGPLGRGFQVGGGQGRSVLVGGGIGIAPFPFLVRRLLAVGRSVTVLAGWKTSGKIVGVEKIESMGAFVEVATEDGTRGYSGTVVDLLRTRLSTHLKDRDFGEDANSTLYACGPKGMLAQVARLGRLYDIPCQVSLEQRMACGVGVCYGCAIEGSGGVDSSPEYKLVCRDGPVFQIHEVRLE